jgi:hypothetical protein
MLSDIVLYVGGSPQRKVLQFHYDIFLGVRKIGDFILIVWEDTDVFFASYKGFFTRKNQCSI